jgi:hypothetical protein
MKWHNQILLGFNKLLDLSLFPVCVYVCIINTINITITTVAITITVTTTITSAGPCLGVASRLWV